MSQTFSSGRRVPDQRQDKRQGKSPEHQARGLLHALGLARRCMRLHSATEQDRATWTTEVGRLLGELRALQARGVDLSKFPGGEEFATAVVGAIGAG